MIYVASRVLHGGIWRDYRANGHPIISTWIDEAGEGQTADMGELWTRIVDEIRRSTCLVLVVHGIGDLPLKGALVEAGIALALGKPVHVCVYRIDLEPRSFRPIGSWVNHPNVRVYEDNPNLDQVLQWAMRTGETA